MGEVNNSISNFVQHEYRCVLQSSAKLRLKLSDERKCEKNSNDKKIKPENMKFSVRNDITCEMSFKPKLPKSFYIIKLREWAEEIPIIGLQHEWKNNIMELIFGNKEYRYHQHVQALIQEIKKLYMDDMQQLAIKLTVVEHDKNLSDNVGEIYGVNNVNTIANLHRTVRFMKNRNTLKSKYFLSHTLMRQIIDLSLSILMPHIIVDFSYYNALGIIQLSEMRVKIKNDLKNGSFRIKEEYHKRITKVILNSKSLQKMPPHIIQKFIQCATNLFIQQILHMKMTTVNHIIEAVKFEGLSPKIAFTLVFEDALLTIKPSLDEVKTMYRDIICEVDKLGQDLLVFEICQQNNKNFTKHNDYMRTKMPDWFINESYNRLEQMIDELFEPLNNHCCNVNAQFKYVYACETRNSIINLIAANTNYTVYYEHVKKFRMYLKQTNAIMPYQHYRAGVLNQIQATKVLRNNISYIIGILIEKLVSHHWKFNCDIYREFETFQSYALDIPNNAKSLFELNDNIVVKSKIIIENLEKNVKESISMLITLFDITTLTDQHINLNTKTINCSFTINDIVIRSNTLCEAMKSELEDELQKKTNILNIDIDNMFPTLIILNDMDDAYRVNEYNDYLKVLVKNIERIDGRIEAINMEERLFKFPETHFVKINDVKKIVLPFFSLNHMIFEWNNYNALWMDGPFEYIDPTKVEQLMNFYQEKFSYLNKSMKSYIKSDMSTCKLFKFTGIIDDPDPMQQPAPMKLCFQALEQINEFNQYVPLIKCICNSALEQRHWREMSEIYGSDITPNAGTTLRKLIDLNLMKNIDEYVVISISANRELALKRQLENMYEQWKCVSFALTYDDAGRLIFINCNEIQVHLDEHLVIVEEMRGSFFVQPIVHQVEKYNTYLNQIRDIIIYFNIIQDECLFLRPIFHDNKMSMEELINVATIYFQIEKTVRNIRESISSAATFNDIIQLSEHSLNLLMMAMDEIEVINKKVRKYLNNVRLFFPRFFFLSDGELVMILFEKDFIKRINSLFRKCFHGVKNVRVNSSKTKITAIISEHNEELELNEKIFCYQEDTNDWMKLAETGILNAVRDDIRKYINNIDIDVSNFAITVNKFSSGISGECIIQLIWTSRIQRCFLKFHPNKLNLNLNIQNCLIDNLIKILNHDLMVKKRIIIMNLVTVMFHQREIINLLRLKNVSNHNEFDWIAQLRYYWDENNVVVGLLNESRKFGYEFSTITQPTINTAFTERCYRTIVEIGRHNLFAALIGHAATGKTETVRGLTRAFAVPLHIINCSQDLSCEQISKIFKGLIACGSWICFKNINSLSLSVLSAVTHRISFISQIIFSNCSQTSFDGSLLSVKTGGNIITTENYHYSSVSFHQHELPENFRALFRVVAFRRADLSKICETRLFASGFVNATKLAKKIQLLYNLCMEQFSYAKHYDFGYRALHTVLRNVINMKFGNPSCDEDTIVLRSLIDVNISMFSNSDMITFRQLLHDIFPNIDVPSIDYTPLFNVLDRIAKSNRIQAHESFQLKIIQTLEMSYFQRVLMLIGDALSGKTSLLRTLAQCLSENIEFEIINQSTMTSQSLFGHLDEKSCRWCDGVYTALLRNHNVDIMNNVKKWIIFDGSIELTWMENLNLIVYNNDNRVLILPTGEKIDISERITVIIETDNIENASPAVVSRCGIINLAHEQFGYKQHIAAWILEQTFFNKRDKFIGLFIEWSLDSCLKFAYDTCQFIIAVEKAHLVVSTLKLCGIYLKNAVNNMDEKDWNNLEIWCQAAAIESIISTFGVYLSTDSFICFNEFTMLLWSNKDINNPVPVEIMQCGILLPSDGMIKDNTFIFKGSGSWKLWTDILKIQSALTLVSNEELPFVPTIDTIKHISIITNHIKYRIPFIICGDASTGKTTLMQFILYKKLSNIEYMTNSFNFSRTTLANQAQRLFILKLNRIMENRYAPPSNKFCINFIDDFNIVNVNGNCSERKSICELIRQYNDHAYWYNLNKPEKLYINDIMFSCALTLNENKHGRILYSRFIRHFNLYKLSIFTHENNVKIFSSNLFYKLKKNLFTADIMGCVNTMINATLDVYKSIINEFKPIPKKFEYHFNMRDILRVIDGCSLIHRESAETKVTLIRLWVHESMRVFGDRMTNQSDSEFLFCNIKSAIKIHFKDSIESVLDNLPKVNNYLTQESLKNLVFVNFMENDNKGINSRRYEEVGSIKLLNNKIIHYLNELNNQCKLKLDILSLPDILEHLIRICRILIIPGGNLFIMCVDGIGIKSLTRLAAYIERQDFFQYTSDQYFDFHKWRENLKFMVKICGCIGKQCTFFITSRYLKDTYFNDIISLVTTGEISQLILPNERREIVEKARLSAQNGDRTLEISINDVMNYFFTQCREKLHLILCDNVSNYCNVQWQLQLYPSVLKYCHIDYFAPWSTDAYLQLGNKYIEKISIENIEREKIVVACKYFYDESKEMSTKYYDKYGRVIHTTPLAFIHFMQLYSMRLSDKKYELMVARNKYLSGLEKLQLASEVVSQMQETLRELRPELEISAQKTEETMREIESENVSVENTTIQVKREEEIANKTAKIAANLKSECEADLAVAIPILEDAISALNTLKPSDITLVKAMKNPPDTVKLVMAAVCVMLDVAAERIIDPITGRKSMDFWGPSKRVLGDMNFLQTLKDYNKDNISPAVMQIIKKTYMTDKNFMPHIVTKASSAAEGLCKWVRAMVSYDEVAKIVAPKKEKLAAAERECNECMVFLNETRKTLAALNDKLTTLNVTLQATLTKKFELENEVKICTQKLVKAETLITSLADEKSKWMQSAEKLKQSYDNLPGDILISCGIITYLAPYHCLFRNERVTLWIEYLENHSTIPCSSNYNFIHSLESEMKINFWHEYGLPKDQFTHENVVIINNSIRNCLIIDLHGQASNWIKHMEQNNHLIVVKLTDENCLQNIARAIEHDCPILVEDIDDNELSALSIDYILLQVKNHVSNEFYHHKTNSNGDNITETKNNYSLNRENKYRLYMTTKFDNLHFHHYIFSKLTIIDFTLTEDALQDKLLDTIISRERPEIHEKFDFLVDNSAANMRLLKQEEDNILTILSTSTINILQDDKSMEILDISKNQSLKIMKNEKYVKIAKNEIDIFRQNYIEFTRYSAILYNTLTPLSNLNCFYRFSLKWLIQVFLKSIVNSRRSVNIKQRVQYLTSSFTTTFHSSVLIVLFNKHRLLYSFLLCLKIQMYSGNVNLKEIDFFMSDHSHYLGKSDIDMNIKPHWLPAKSWREINLLSKYIPTFNSLVMSIKNDELWQNFFNSKNPKNDLLPHQWRKSLTPFQILIIFKIMRSDRMIIEIEHFVTNLSFNIHLKQNLSASYLQSSCLIPLIFILPSYIEPLKQVQELAASMKCTSKFKVLSLGVNMEDEVYNTILQAQHRGEWVLLENCHLALNLMSQLENIYQTINTYNTNLEFRLWLSSMPYREFPMGILESGIKLISDTPTNLKQTLIHCYLSNPLNDTHVFSSCPGKDKILAKFIYAFTFFHILLNERNYFGIHGWNVNYDFCHSDLTMSISQLEFFIKNYDVTANLSLKPLLHMVGEYNYEGKFTDTMDIRCLKAIFHDYCNTNIITQDNYLFGDNYNIPDRCERQDFIQHIINLPDYPSSELFGIDENSMVNRNAIITNEFFIQMSLLDKSMNADNSMLEKTGISTVNLEMIREKLPSTLAIEKAQMKSCKKNKLNEVLVQEVMIYNSIIEFIKESMTLPDNEFARASQLNILPKRWYKHSIYYHHTKSLSKFIHYLNEKHNFFHKWINGQCPTSFWLGIFALPKRFISMSHVMFAKHFRIPIDQLTFDFQVLSIKNASNECQSDEKVLYFHDLYLSGADWDADSGMLITSNHKLIGQHMPVILWKPKFFNGKPRENNYACPLYKSNVGRDVIDHTGHSFNFIIQVQLPTNTSEDYWIKRGTALFCQLE